jgi:hypothetical protein
MRVTRLKLLALTLAGLVAFALLGRPPGPEAPPPPAGEAEPSPEIVASRLIAKGQIAEDVAAGRRSLVEAAALFGALNRLPPLAPDPTLRDEWYPPPLRVPIRTNAERLCRQVADWVTPRLWEKDPAREAEVVARLEAEFREELRAHGAIRLPDPSALTPVQELLDAARARRAAQGRPPGQQHP